MLLCVVSGEKKKKRISEYNLSIADNKQKVYLETYRVKNLGNKEWLEKKRARSCKYALKMRIEVKQQLELDKKELFVKKMKLDMKNRVDDFKSIIKSCKELEGRLYFEYSRLCQELKSKQTQEGIVSFE